MHRITPLLAASLLLRLNSWAVTINIDAEALKDANGARITSGVIVLVADVKDVPGPNGTFVRNGFSGPTPASFSGNDFQVHRWNFTSSSPEYGGPGVFQAAITLNYSGLWQAGDPLRLYWFPANTASDTGPGAGKPFGTYRSNTPEPGAAQTVGWFSPSNSVTVAVNDGLIVNGTATLPKESTISLALLTTDASTLVTPGSGTTPGNVGTASSAMVVGRYVFYNNSAWDANTVGASASDDAAIAIDKVALFTGGIATFANYTSYSKGINGIMVDLANAANSGAISASDFTFKIGNSSTPSGWSAAPSPSSVTVRSGAGFNGSDRVTLIWADNAIQKEWLEVTVLPTASTALAIADVFYFGNAVGETGNTAGNSTPDARVNLVDEILARNNGSFAAAITSPYDFNRDKRVNLVDEILARNNAAIGPAQELKLVQP